MRVEHMPTAKQSAWRETGTQCALQCGTIASAALTGVDGPIQLGQGVEHHAL